MTRITQTIEAYETHVPAHLNGCAVVEDVQHPQDGAHTVMVYNPRNAHHPYVVATWYPDLGEHWEHGDYCATPVEAADAFRARLKKRRAYLR